MKSDDAELLQKFQSIMSISNRVKKADVAGALGLTENELLQKLIRWREQLSFKIDGDMIVADDMPKLVEALDQQFDAWNSRESTKGEKIFEEVERRDLDSRQVDAEIQHKNETQLNETPQANSTWNKHEQSVVILGQYSWLLILIAASYNLVSSIILLNMSFMLPPLTFSGIRAISIWYMVSSSGCLVILLLYVLPVFVKKVQARDWEFIVYDAFNFGRFRVPKSLFFSFLLFALNYWGAIMILIAAIFICFLSPMKLSWKKNSTSSAKEKVFYGK
nr:hypothetical protein [Candidatus Sigynarchaeota archaeon]